MANNVCFYCLATHQPIHKNVNNCPALADSHGHKLKQSRCLNGFKKWIPKGSWIPMYLK